MSEEKTIPGFEVLRHEFENLGYNYDKIKNNGGITFNKGNHRVFFEEYSDSNSIPKGADNITVFFTINNSAEKPFIEKISGSVYCKSQHEISHQLFEKNYSIRINDLPKKWDLLEDMQEAFYVAQVAKEFSRIGFDYHKLEQDHYTGLNAKPTRYDRLKYFHEKIKNINPDNPEDEVVFSFLISRTRNKPYTIKMRTEFHHFPPTDKPKKCLQVLNKQTFTNAEAPLPTKDQILSETTTVLLSQKLNEQIRIAPNTAKTGYRR